MFGLYGNFVAYFCTRSSIAQKRLEKYFGLLISLLLSPPYSSKWQNDTCSLLVISSCIFLVVWFLLVDVRKALRYFAWRHKRQKITVAFKKTPKELKPFPPFLHTLDLTASASEWTFVSVPYRISRNCFLSVCNDCIRVDTCYKLTWNSSWV